MIQLMDVYMIGLLVISFASLYGLTIWCYKQVNH